MCRLLWPSWQWRCRTVSLSQGSLLLLFYNHTFFLPISLPPPLTPTPGPAVPHGFPNPCSPFLKLYYFEILHKWNHKVCTPGDYFYFSLGIILWSFIQVVACINCSFPLLSSTLCVYHSFFNSLPVEEVLAYFQLLVVMNKAFTNIHVQVFVWTCVFISWDRCLRVQLLDLMIIACLVLFKKT